jgi:hypothetical protein
VLAMSANFSMLATDVLPGFPWHHLTLLVPPLRLG